MHIYLGKYSHIETVHDFADARAAKYSHAFNHHARDSRRAACDSSKGRADQDVR